MNLADSRCEQVFDVVVTKSNGSCKSISLQYSAREKEHEIEHTASYVLSSLGI
jgi:hypothetical protein